MSLEWVMWLQNPEVMTLRVGGNLVIVGAPGSSGGSISAPIDGQDGEDGSMGIPGPQGPRGVPGLFVPGMDGQDADDSCTAIGPTTGLYDRQGAAAAVTPTTLGLVIGTNVEAHGARLDSIQALVDAAGWLHNDGAGAFAYSTPSKSDVGLGNVENTALSTWAGSTNLVTLGTVATGTWHGTAVADTYVASAATWNGKQAAYTNLTSMGSLVNAAGWLHNDGAGAFAYSTPTAAQVGALASGGTAADSSKLGGALPAAYALVGQTMNIGTTAVAINRASAALVLTGITSIDGDAATLLTKTWAIPGTIGSTTPNTGAFTTLSASDTFTPAQVKGIIGTTTNNSAQAGSVGELIDSAVTGVTINTTDTNLTSIALTAGDWDVMLTVTSVSGGTSTYIRAGISQSSATITGARGKDYAYFPFNTTAQVAAGFVAVRVLLSGNTTIYAVATAQGAAITTGVDGYLQARRRR